MNEINQLNENEIRQYSKLHSEGGIGEQVSNALRDYNARLIDIKCNDFYADDNSSTKATINELLTQMKAVEEAMNEVDLMIDNLLFVIQTGILDEEDRIAHSVSEE